MSKSDLSEETRAALGAKTKGRILVSSLDAFNRLGFERVTTAQLADAAGVLEGTLWYHFNSKKHLPLAHLDALEARLDAHLKAPFEGSPSEQIAHFFKVFDLLWDFRYLLRDPIAVLQDEEEGRLRLKRVYENVEQRTQERLLRAEQLGLIDLSGTDAQSLAVSCFLTGRYWLDYARIRFGGELNSDAFRELGLAQIVSLIRPHMTKAGYQMLQTSLGSVSPHQRHIA